MTLSQACASRAPVAFLPGKTKTERLVPLEGLFQGPEHLPFSLDGLKPQKGTVPTAILVHGFGGTPAELRDLATALNGIGWDVHGILLPGFGRDIASLPNRNYTEWVGSVEEAACQLIQTRARPLMLLGYSMGATISMVVSVSVRPEALVLVAPFWWEERVWQRVVGAAIRPFLPSSFRPLKRADFSNARIREGIAKLLPGADLDDPQVLAGLRDFRVPLRLVDEVRHLSRVALESAPRVGGRVLVVQGRQDEIVRTERTRKLLKRLPPATDYVEVNGGHDLIQTRSPAWPGLARTVLSFAQSVCAQDEEPVSNA